MKKVLNRSLMTWFIAFAFFIGLGYFVINLVIHSSEWAQKPMNAHLSVTGLAQAGDILDRNGDVLATSDDNGNRHYHSDYSTRLALLHAVAVVKAGAFCTLRVVLYVFGPDMAKYCHGADILAWMAVFTIIISSFIAMRKYNLKARLAFSTVGQLSYIVLGICILTPYSTAGALYHIVAHAFMKITLFMAAGAIFVTTHKKDIREMVGIGRRMPVTMIAFTAASIGIAGFPFFVGFVSKANIIMGAVAMGQPAFVATLIASALLALTYLMPVVMVAFKKNVDNPDFAEGGEAAPAMLVPLVITAIISVILGIAPNACLHLFDLAVMAGNQIFAPLM